MPFVNIADIKITYSISGAGERLLLFPDNHLSSQAYQDDIEFFALRFEVVVAFDVPTMGQSTHEILYPDERKVDYWDLGGGHIINIEIYCQPRRSHAIKRSHQVPILCCFEDAAGGNRKMP